MGDAERWREVGNYALVFAEVISLQENRGGPEFGEKMRERGFAVCRRSGDAQEEESWYRARGWSGGQT